MQIPKMRIFGRRPPVLPAQSPLAIRATTVIRKLLFILPYLIVLLVFIFCVIVVPSSFPSSSSFFFFSSLVSRPSSEHFTKYVWITPRSDGFNNQLISVYEGLLCAAVLNRTAVLPYLFENVRKDTTPSGPYPFEDYFDLGPLTTAGFHPPVTTVPVLRRALDNVSGIVSTWTLFLRRWQRKPNFHHICHDGRLYHAEHKSFLHGLPVLRFYARRSFRHLQLFNMTSSATGRHTPAQTGANLKKPEHTFHLQCIDDSLCPSNHIQLGPYSDYRVHGQGFDIRLSPTFHYMRRRLHPAQPIRDLAKAWIKTEIGEKFNAMHVRRSDYLEKCRSDVELCRMFGKSAVVQSEKTLLQTLKRFSNQTLPVFVSTTDVKACKRILSKEKVDVRVVYMQDFGVPTEYQRLRTRTDQLSLASQVVASYANEFVGNRFSSYTSEINNMRYVRNGEQAMMFFDGDE